MSELILACIAFLFLIGTVASLFDGNLSLFLYFLGGTIINIGVYVK